LLKSRGSKEKDGAHKNGAHPTPQPFTIHDSPFSILNSEKDSAHKWVRTLQEIKIPEVLRMFLK
jgi:hypothetical protein